MISATRIFEKIRKACTSEHPDDHIVMLEGIDMQRFKKAQMIIGEMNDKASLNTEILEEAFGLYYDYKKTLKSGGRYFRVLNDHTVDKLPVLDFPSASEHKATAIKIQMSDKGWAGIDKISEMTGLNSREAVMSQAINFYARSIIDLYNGITLMRTSVDDPGGPGKPVFICSDDDEPALNTNVIDIADYKVA